MGEVFGFGGVELEVEEVIGIVGGVNQFPVLVADGVFGGVLREALTAFVRNPGRRLEENEALACLLRVGAAAGHVAREGVEIPFGVLAAERKFEPGLAVGVAVTLAGVAASFGKHGHHIVAKGDARKRPRLEDQRGKQAAEQARGHLGWKCE